VGRESNALKAEILERELDFRYTVMEMRGVSAELLLGSDSLSDNVLAILGDMKDARTVIRTI